ncbi:hypothetical protein IC575_004561 [Cucumis melo]
MRSCGRHVQDLLLKFLLMEKGFFTSRRVIWNKYFVISFSISPLKQKPLIILEAEISSAFWFFISWKSPQIRSLITKSLILISLPRSYVVLLTFVCWLKRKRMKSMLKSLYTQRLMYAYIFTS